MFFLSALSVKLPSVTSLETLVLSPALNIQLAPQECLSKLSKNLPLCNSPPCNQPRDPSSLPNSPRISLTSPELSAPCLIFFLSFLSSVFFLSHQPAPLPKQRIPSKYLQAARPKKQPPLLQLTASADSLESSCYVSTSHWSSNSTTLIPSSQLEINTWPYGIVTLGKTDCMKTEPHIGVYSYIINFNLKNVIETNRKLKV